MSADPRRPVEWLYRLLVAFYPPDFRRRFGTAMVGDFGEMVDSEGQARALFRVVKDLVVSLPSAWFRAVRESATASPLAPGRIFREVRFGARALRRDLGFTGPAVAVLGLSIGVGTVVLGVVNAYLLRPLPYPSADRIVSVDPPLSLALDEVREVLEIPLTWERDAFTLVGDGRPEQVLGSWVTPGFLEVYGITPVIGRGFLPNELGEGAPQVAILSHALWQRRFGGDPGVLGRTLQVYSSDQPDEAESYTVVGVTPRDLWLHHSYADLLVPIRQLNPIYEGRLREGLPLERAEEVLTNLARGRVPEIDAGERVVLTPLDERYVARVRPTLMLLSLTALLVLVIACGNAALLCVVRTRKRSRELAVRRALGAGRGTVAVQLVVEGLILAALAGAVGALVAVGALEALETVVPRRLGLQVPGGGESLRIDAGVFATLVGTCGILGVVFGLLPLMGVQDQNLSGGIRGAPRGDRTTRGNRRLQDVVMGAELAFSLALLVAAGLAARSARHVSTVDLGFDASALTMAGMTLRERSYPDADSRVDFQRRLAAALRDLPGATSAGMGVRAPVGRRYSVRPVEAEGRPGSGGSLPIRAEPQIAAADYFTVLGLPTLQGRPFGPDDVPGAPAVAVVSEGLARTLWPGEDPIGQRFREAPGEGLPWRRVVGVVPDVQQDPLADPVGDYYLPLSQEAPRFVTLFIRTGPERVATLDALEETLRDLDPEIAVAGVQSVESMVREITGPGRFLAFLLAVFGAFAVGLALLGLYGTVAYATAQRRFEVAVRMALGARRAELSGLFVRERLGVLAGGVVLGLVGAFLIARLLADQLRGVSTSDPLTYAGSALVLGALALAAVWLPARKAARTEPMLILREE